MRGKHHIIIESPRLKYEFDIRRNLTIIRGESATGKTTLIELLDNYRRGGEDSTVQLTSDVSCRVFADSSDTWQQALELIRDSIVFIDEDNHFLRTKEFAETVRGSSNYFVLITREALPELPYSINEIYGIRTTGKFHFPEQIYHELYPLYEKMTEIGETQGMAIRILTEDSQSGFQFFKSLDSEGIACVSAEGNSSVLSAMKRISPSELLIVIADGAAFGAFVEKVLQYAMLRCNTLLYFPEAFEWIILKSGVVTERKHFRQMEFPEDYANSEQYMSWEQYFTDLLIQLTKDDPIRQYQKSKLKMFYVQGAVRDQIINTLPEEIKEILR